MLIGLGATNYGSVDVTIAGVNRSLGGETQFSTTWAAGVKLAARAVGIRLAMEWTPTYIKTDRGRLVVRSVLGMLRGGELPVFRSAPVQRWRDVPLLIRPWTP